MTIEFDRKPNKAVLTQAHEAARLFYKSYVGDTEPEGLYIKVISTEEVKDDKPEDQG